MNKSYQKLLFFLFLCINSNLLAQDGPKEIIQVEEEKVLGKDDSFKNRDLSNPAEPTVLDDENTNIEENNIQKLVIDDIPEEFNSWYGILSSKDGGLGWLMWGNTEYKFSLELLRQLPTKINYSSALELYSNLLLSRAQSPKIMTRGKNLGDSYSLENEDLKYEYFDEKIRLMVEVGLSDRIQLLENSIPLEMRDILFKNRVQDIRFKHLDIYYICENIQNKLKNTENKVFTRKTLIACNIAKKKNDEAFLALDLLENDIEEQDYFLNTARFFIENDNLNINDVDFKNIDPLLRLILSLSKKDYSQKQFNNNKLNLDLLVYKMQLYKNEDQLEALERLTNVGIYDFQTLNRRYIEYSNKTIEQAFDNKDLETKNSFQIRNYFFKKALQSSDNVEKAKNLNLLWKKADNADIRKAISNITSDMTSSIEPENKLNWFAISASKNLMLSDNLEEAKKWLFLGKVNPIERASLDPNFCKALLLLYIKDNDIFSNNNDLPNINFLLEVLYNDINTDIKTLERLVISLKALDFDIEENIWKKLIFNKKNNPTEKIRKVSNHQSLIFNLKHAIKNSNKAEVVITSIMLLSDYYENNNYTSLYHSLEALRALGLERYAKELVFEINSDILG